jgi:vancomycin resistance protein YoaR
VTYARGYRLGSAFVDGQYDPRGALGGGICAASTALYVSAVRAGLELGERHPHSSYIDSYPLGLDAAVGGYGSGADSMRFRNDTANPIVIITEVVDGYRQRFELWGVDDGRQVEIETGTLWGARRGANGFWGGVVTVERVVRDRSGATIHQDRIVSSYVPR